MIMVTIDQTPIGSLPKRVCTMQTESCLGSAAKTGITEMFELLLSHGATLPAKSSRSMVRSVHLHVYV